VHGTEDTSIFADAPEMEGRRRHLDEEGDA
jgi:hypothetical protein